MLLLTHTLTVAVVCLNRPYSYVTSCMSEYIAQDTIRSNHLRHEVSAVCERCCWQEINHHKSTRCARHTSSLQQQPHWFSDYECCEYHVTELIFRHNLWVKNNLMMHEGWEPRAFFESRWFIMTTCMTLTEHYPVSQDHFSVPDSLSLIRVKTQQSSCYHDANIPFDNHIELPF